MPNEIQFILYNLPEEKGKVQVIIRDETLWCTQKAMAQLFNVDRTVVSKHLKNIFESSELQQDSVCANFAHTAEDGKIYNTQFYNLDAVISVGYRVNSLQATRFRQWATKILNEYIKKGFVLDDDRLKQGETVFGQDYFQELLEESVPYVPVNVGFGRKLRIYMLSVALTMTRTPQQHTISMR